MTCGVKFCEGWGFVCQPLSCLLVILWFSLLCFHKSVPRIFGGTHLLARKVDAHGAVSDLLDGNLELVAGDTADDDVADGETVVHCHVGLLFYDVLLVA